MAYSLSAFGAQMFAELQVAIAESYGVDLATKMFSVDPTIAQELNDAITAKSDFLGRINVIPVTEIKGQKVFIGVSGPVTGRTNTKTTDREAKDASSLDQSTYELSSTESDVGLPYAKIDAWAKFPDFHQRYSAAVQKQIALDRIMVGFHGTHAAVQTDIAQYGLPHKPFITQILPHGLSLPRVPKGDQVWQHSEACQQRVDADGNWLRQTDGKIQDKAIEREVEAMQNTESFQSHTRTVDNHSTESVGGIKTIEALGALKLLSGGSASLAAVDDLHQATGRDLNLVVGQKHNATVGGDMEERIQGMRKSVAVVSQRLVAPKTWLGSDGVNVLQVLCDLLDLVQQMNTQLASHTHGPTPVPGNASLFVSNSGTATQLAAKIKTITP